MLARIRRLGCMAVTHDHRVQLPGVNPYAPLTQWKSNALLMRESRVRVAEGAPILGCSQAVRQEALNLRCSGSIPLTPAILEVWYIECASVSKTGEVGLTPATSAKTALVTASEVLALSRRCAGSVTPKGHQGSVFEAAERSGLQHRWSNPSWVRIPSDPPYGHSVKDKAEFIPL